MADGGAEVPVVHRLVTLPYWGSYQAWADHYAVECSHCLAVMSPVFNGTGEIEDLCTMGRALATAANWAVDSQRQLAAQN